MTKKNDDTLRGKADVFRNYAIERKRSMKLRDNERALLKIIQDLDSKYENLVVIVEGNRDVSVLRNLGVKAPIIKTQTKLPRYRMIEQIVERAGKRGKVLILTDYDQEGKETCNYIEKELELAGVKTLKGVRIRIRKLMGNWRCIEEFVALFNRRDSPESESSVT
ncbi:MAG: toprim domain-containing protein [Candidatus Odinarchaeota archaeon]